MRLILVREFYGLIIARVQVNVYSMARSLSVWLRILFACTLLMVILGGFIRRELRSDMVFFKVSFIFVEYFFNSMACVVGVVVVRAVRSQGLRLRGV